MYGNCLTFAIFDFIKNGGLLCIEFWDGRYIPHFSVQRGDTVCDLKIMRFIFNILWYEGEERITASHELEAFDCRRYPMLHYNKQPHSYA